MDEVCKICGLKLNTAEEAENPHDCLEELTRRWNALDVVSFHSKTEHTQEELLEMRQGMTPIADALIRLSSRRRARFEKAKNQYEESNVASIQFNETAAEVSRNLISALQAEQIEELT